MQDDHDWPAMLKAAAAERGPEITPSEFLESTELPLEAIATILSRWPALRKAAGLDEAAPRRQRPRFTNLDLLAEYGRVVKQLGRYPTWMELNRHAAMSYQTFRARFGTTSNLKRAYLVWARFNRLAIEGNEQARETIARYAEERRQLASMPPFDPNQDAFNVLADDSAAKVAEHTSRDQPSCPWPQKEPREAEPAPPRDERPPARDVHPAMRSSMARLRRKRRHGGSG